MRAWGYRGGLIDGMLPALIAVTVMTDVPAIGATLPLALIAGQPPRRSS
ncbi:hypothetical protein ABZ914_27700 [Spirillospora sp. NPDC046719]